jgi:serine/threonine protein kinase
VYRDLKPDNIGFDVRGDVKLFDFGLSVEITDKHPRTENGLFKLSGNTGSLRYMAPEVALEKAYNHKVDVYSYGILLWQVSGGPCAVSFVVST